MPIEKGKAVQFHYRLAGIDGEVLETSDQGQPAAYLHGHRNILPALEETLAGKDVGDKISVTLSPAEAYGERMAEAQQRVPIKHLLTKGKLRPGMAVKINTEQGPRDARIIKVGRFNVDVDTNHPLAGLSLTFDVEIVDVRDGSAEEIAHGHVHGPGDHQH